MEKRPPAVPRRELDVGDFSDIRSIGEVCGNLKEAAHFEIEAWIDCSNLFGVEVLCSQRAPTTLVEGKRGGNPVCTFSPYRIGFSNASFQDQQGTLRRLGYRIEHATVDFKIRKATYQTFSDFKRWMQKIETKKMKEDKGSLSGW